MRNKTDIVILLKESMNYEYLSHELLNKINESRTLYTILHILVQTSTDKNTID